MSEDKKKAIICDLDGTLCIHNGRSPFDYNKCDTDKPNKSVMETIKLFKEQGYSVLLVSGREDYCREKTEGWLDKYGVQYDMLQMRKSGDMRADTIVKKEIYNSYIGPYYDVLFCLDDRDKVVALWRGMGLACWQVNYGNF